ncbi:MAG: segregation/condensation protein A [Saprospiraceae bacterium]|nr:segregation/condensation protein A [Saprospiraceae bacterium]
MEGYKIKLQQFEGPFDLLLFFIERDELDIYDIPISKITDDFLSYIKQLETLNIDVASEFILVAATLMRIKAKMLIPRKEIDEEGNEIDPREELTQRLLEYKKYKDILEEMRVLEAERSKKFERSGVASELKDIATKALVDIELESLTMFKLLKTFEKLIARYEDRQNRTYHEIVKYPYTVENQQTYIFQIIKITGTTTFTRLFEGLENRVHAIVTFLSLLEMLNLQKVAIQQREGINNFEISLA